MRTADFDFKFPESLIAYQPLPRGAARLLVVDRDGHSSPKVTVTGALVDFLNPGDALVLNDTLVLRARVKGVSSSGSPVEILLLRPISNGSTLGEIRLLGMKWEAMVKPAKRFKIGDRITFSPRMVATVATVLEGGTRYLDFALDSTQFYSELEKTGKIPLPPYIKREAEAEDEIAYQSLFAENPGSVAAPTASLHLSASMLEGIAAKGVEIHKVTLHVGAGTFRPVQSENILDHDMHSEMFSFSETTATALNTVRRRGGKIWAVGTTAARVLETQSNGKGSDRFEPGQGETRIFIYPGYLWKGVDGLLTNFHWPKSTLFMLVCSLLGTERTKQIYSEAFAQGFRLFSFGDAMLIR